jgi:antitoxin VapB
VDPMTRTKIFKTGNSQAVHIPVDMQYERIDINYSIERAGDEIIIRPEPHRLTALLKKFSAFTPEFMENGRRIEYDSPDER